MAEAQERGLVIYQSRDGQEIRLSFDVVRKYLVSGHPEMVTDQEIVLYMGMAKARGLNPFKKDCYLVKYTTNDPAATIVSIDYFRSRARAQPDCVGWKAGIMIADENKKIEYRDGSFLMDGENLVGGWFKARPQRWEEEYIWTIALKPYIKTTKEGRPTQFWQLEKQAYMICKVVESQGLRRLWPDEFQGLFVEGDYQPIDISDVSEKPRIRTPKPLPTEEKTDDADTKTESQQAGSAQSGSDAGAAASQVEQHERENRREVSQASETVTDKKSEESQKDERPIKQPEHTVEEVALETIAGWTKENFPGPSALNFWMKGQSITVQTKLTAAYNARKKELGM